MGFDDYNYRFYNESVFNPKALRQINEDEEMEATFDHKQGNL